MKIIRNIFILSLFAFLTIPLQAQVLNRISRSAQNAAERAAERAVTRKVEKEVTQAVEKAFEGGEKKESTQKEATTTTTKPEEPAPTPAPHTGPVREAPKNADKFPFEHGSYVQVAEVLGVEVKMTLYFSRWGEWQTLENKSEIRVFGFTTKEDKLHITKGNTRWDIDMAEKTGVKYEITHSPDETDAALKAALGGDPADGMEIIELGTENYIGYACRKVQIKYPITGMDLICLTYGTLVMKSDGRIGPLKTTTRILSIDLSAPPASIFEVPAGVTITSN
ncbi:MAG: DUF4412 domain-containing protein [Bacteroidales bacterium]|nr:DUF4412 domain-containing protein [Bacteroidales bacterium]